MPCEQRNRTLWFVATAGHHCGSIGITTFLRQHARDLVPKLRCAIHLEHIGREFIERDGALVGAGLPEPAAIFVSNRPALVAAVKQAVIKHDLQRTLVLPAAGGFGPRPHGESRASFAVGVPVIGLISGLVYLLIEDDTLDKVAVDRLAPTAAAFVEIIGKLNADPPQYIRSE